ncbi:hypothetical protein OPKNFCMD_6098 [Methylobacterium crusticola]|uniref:Uncharacterized protein n=1 Tax=Methylobacterium crusticola TaxID=1697972 RepID=A0ABQ4R6M7_9HYPH|nr:hypothetical protein OPKNFCMD_6098 [Methylobacterium crusticola]
MVSALARTARRERPPRVAPAGCRGALPRGAAAALRPPARAGDLVVYACISPTLSTAGRWRGPGLSQVHGFVRQAGGQVRTTSAIFLPRSAGTACRPEAAAPPPARWRSWPGTSRRCRGRPWRASDPGCRTPTAGRASRRARAGTGGQPHRHPVPGRGDAGRHGRRAALARSSRLETCGRASGPCSPRAVPARPWTTRASRPTCRSPASPARARSPPTSCGSRWAGADAPGAGRAPAGGARRARAAQGSCSKVPPFQA